MVAVGCGDVDWREVLRGAEGSSRAAEAKMKQYSLYLMVG